MWSNQAVFRKGYSTSSLSDFLDVVLNEIDIGTACGVLFLDQRRAINSVHHQLLLYKLKSTGVSASVLKWCSSYLTDQFQTPKVNGIVSIGSHVGNGILQGSILGPLLFVIFINDLPRVVSQNHLHLYAVDMAITITGITAREIESQLNEKPLEAKDGPKCFVAGLKQDKCHGFLELGTL